LGRLCSQTKAQNAVMKARVHACRNGGVCRMVLCKLWFHSVANTWNLCAG